MVRLFGTWIGKLLQLVLRVTHGGGQALPGLVVERLLPGYLPRMLAQVPEGIVVITGTNGKTTTTKIVVELLSGQGKKVLYNPTGSNLTRGIVSALAAQASWRGKLNFDIAVLELDEAFARRFTNVVKPDWVLALNVSRDQLDRYGEVDHVARLIGESMLRATRGIITNANDPHLSVIAKQATVPVSYFGVAENLRLLFPTDREIVAVDKASKPLPLEAAQPFVELQNIEGQKVSYGIAGEPYEATLKLDGQHNFLNAAAAVALVLHLVPEADEKMLLKSLENITPAFGRGEHYQLKNGSNLQIALVKNPASFRQSLASYLQPGVQVMVAINDNLADSRDMSWLWDVDLSPLQGYTVLLTTGSRAADMALRLQYDDVPVEQVEPDLSKALRQYCALPGDKLLLSSYTAMLRLHDELKRKAGKNL